MSFVAGQMKVKYGTVSGGSSVDLTLGAGFLFYNIGGSHGGLYNLDYWTGKITLIGGNPIDGLGSITQDELDSYVFNITTNQNIDLSFLFIGYF